MFTLTPTQSKFSSPRCTPSINTKHADLVKPVAMRMAMSQPLRVQIHLVPPFLAVISHRAQGLLVVLHGFAIDVVLFRCTCSGDILAVAISSIRDPLELVWSVLKRKCQTFGYMASRSPRPAFAAMAQTDTFAAPFPAWRSIPPVWHPD